MVGGAGGGLTNQRRAYHPAGVANLPYAVAGGVKLIQRYTEFAQRVTEIFIRLIINGKEDYRMRSKLQRRQGYADNQADN